MGYNVNQSVNSSGQQGYAPQQSVGMLGGGGVIPVTALTNLGVAAEAVGQISELKNYLSRQVCHCDKTCIRLYRIRNLFLDAYNIN